MQNFKSVIAKILLTGYLIGMVVPALPAETLSFVTSGKVKKVCKSSYVIEQKHDEARLQLKFSPAEERVLDLSQAGLFLFCSSTSTYIPSVFANELLTSLQQENDFASFNHSLYTILFQELDPDPPKTTFC